MAKSWSAAKDPQEVRDFGIDWSADIGQNTIVSSAWSIVSGGVTIDSDISDDTTTTARLSGGALNEICELQNHIILSNGEELELTGKLKIRAK